MSFGRQEVGPEADEQELMNAFGGSSKKYKSDFEMLSTCEEIFSFEVEWDDLCADPVIQDHRGQSSS